VGVDVDGDGEAQPRLHARRVALDRRVDEPLEPGEGDDVGEALVDAAAGNAEDRGVQVDVVAAAKLRVEAGAKLEQGGDAALDGDAPGGGGEQARGQLQQGALAGAVRADDAQRLARRHGKANVAQRPEVLAPAAR